MELRSLSGGFENAPIDASRAFRAVLNAMARPGVIEPITGAQGPAPMSSAMATVMLTLCDPETPIYLAASHNTPDIRDWIAFHIGAPIVTADKAAFAIGTWDTLCPVTQFPIGTSEYPDQSATVIVDVEHLDQHGATLRGPGIKDTAQLNLPDVVAFQMNTVLFPLGLDFILTAGDQVAALPRTTKVEVV